MKFFSLIAVMMFSFSVFAERINLPENTQAMEAVMELDFVVQEIEALTKLAGSEELELIHISSKDVGIREDLGISEEYNSGNTHKFLFETADSSMTCKFSIYVIYQHTVPLSINKMHSSVTREASCY